MLLGESRIYAHVTKRVKSSGHVQHDLIFVSNRLCYLTGPLTGPEWYPLPSLRGDAGYMAITEASLPRTTMMRGLAGVKRRLPLEARGDRRVPLLASRLPRQQESGLECKYRYVTEALLSS